MSASMVFRMMTNFSLTGPIAISSLMVFVRVRLIDSFQSETHY